MPSREPLRRRKSRIVPAAFLVVGHFRHDSYAEKTALLAGEAYADSAIVDVVMKVATRRLRPSDIPRTGLSPTPSSTAMYPLPA